MLHPAVVFLTTDLRVVDALGRLDEHSDGVRVVLRRQLGDRFVWYVFPAAELRRRLAGEPPETLLEEALSLEGVTPAETLQALEEADTEGFTGVVLDGDRLVGVAEPAPGELREAARGDIEPPPPPPGRPLDYGFRGGGRDREAFDVVPVFYATDRAPTGDLEARSFYAAGRGELSFGIAEVSLPQGHRPGEMERPRWWRLELREDPARHVVLMSVRRLEREDFATRLRRELGQAGRPEALIFVHGYRVTFEEAARRTAQIAHDLAYDGIPMLYSWPSRGTLMGYLEDETNARWTVGHFQEVLELALTRLGARQVHVLAHSMGNRPLIETLERFDTAALPAGSATLSQVIFAAPDFDADTFRSLARVFPARARSLTLYASSNDEALRASRELRGGLARAGESGPGLVVVEEVDTIDASAVDTGLLGHSYYGERTILSDIFYLLRDGRGPDDRFGLRARELGGLRYWELLP